MKFNLDNLLAEYSNLEHELENPEVYSDPKRLKEIMQKKKSLEQAVVLYREYKQLNQNYNDAKKMFDTEKDIDMIEMAKEEMLTTETRIVQLEEELKLALLPKDPNDEKNLILEVRAGAWGDEAGLFARELTNAYILFAKEEGYNLEIIDQSENDGGGLKECIMKITGFGAYSRFKYEAWVHRVQRIPETENKWRVHTSAVTVAVLPEVDPVEIVIRDEDLEIMACRASGAGGQKVNKTSSAIRMVHIPTGLVVECQDERSQLQNKMKALDVLRSRIYTQAQAKVDDKLGADRLAQVGTGDRSEKIRTYNFPQDRVTDHRIGQNFSNIPVIMTGRLAPIFDALAIADQSAKLEAASKATRE